MEKNSLLLALSGVLIASCAQLFMKSSAHKRIGQKFWKKFVNFKVIFAYSMMLIASFINVLSLKHLQLKYVPMVEATGYIWVPILSILFIHEKPTKYNIIGCIIIIIGMCMFAHG